MAAGWAAVGGMVESREMESRATVEKSFMLWLCNMKQFSSIYSGMRDVWSSNAQKSKVTGKMHQPYIEVQNHHTLAPVIRFGTMRILSGSGRLWDGVCIQTLSHNYRSSSPRS